MKQIRIYWVLLMSPFAVWAQQPKDKSKFNEYKAGYYENSILKGIEEQAKTEVQKPTVKTFKIDVSGKDIPTNPELYTTVWRNTPISQGNTGTCWSFSATSFFETEVYRLSKQQIKLSEIYTVYWEYVEKAAEFVRTRGKSVFDEGSQGNGVLRVFKKYGAVPWDQYNGLKNGKNVHDHSKMAEEMRNYLKAVKESNAWNETEVTSTIKAILNYYLGEPPLQVSWGGKKISPQEFVKTGLKLNLEDYLDVTSTVAEPYFTKVEYKVADNWWHSKDYHNLPLDDFMKVLKQSVRNGYGVMIAGDVSEAGFDSRAQVAMVPSFDIPSDYIDENARYFRFQNGSTTDDHGMHIIGFYEKDGKDWYLVKDSGAGSRNVAKDSKSFGYYFMHEDYIKLKMMCLLIHKDMLKDYLPMFK